MEQLDAYLDELVAYLNCDPLRRDEIRLEVHAHLREMVETNLAAGMAAEQAVEAAVDEFGPPREVARRLTAANCGRAFAALKVSAGRRVLGVMVATAASLIALMGLNVLGSMLLNWLTDGGNGGRLAASGWVYAGTHLVVGALAAFIVWLVSSRPLDALVASAAMALAGAFSMLYMYGFFGRPAPALSLSTVLPTVLVTTAVQSAAMFAATILVALLLNKRTRPRISPLWSR